MHHCGFCNGSGIVANHQADKYGPRPDYPATRTCEYCNGSGQCADGNKLLPQGHVYRATAEDQQRAGAPPWA